jgi:hypothetical protein
VIKNHLWQFSDFLIAKGTASCSRRLRCSVFSKLPTSTKARAIGNRQSNRGRLQVALPCVIENHLWQQRVF